MMRVHAGTQHTRSVVTDVVADEFSAGSFMIRFYTVVIGIAAPAQVRVLQPMEPSHQGSIRLDHVKQCRTIAPSMPN
jgi:hypothetical protein